MTKRYTYALKTIMILYDGLFEGCQGDFVTSFGEKILKKAIIKITIILIIVYDNPIYYSFIERCIIASDIY